MRELYAVELRSDEAGGQASIDAKRLVSEWATRTFEGLTPEDLLPGPADRSTPTGRLITLAGSDGGWVLRWSFANEADSTLYWLVEVAVSGPNESLMVTARIRIGHDTGAPIRLGPLSYEFRTPTVVRTLLDRFIVEDAAVRVEPRFEYVGASAVDALVDFLCDGTRRLPVIVLSGEPTTGRPICDPRELAFALAALAHVRVLSSAFAGRRLTEAVGRERSVWWGAGRIYWPGFERNARPYDHRLWRPDRLRDVNRPTLVEELRRWLGSLSSARTPPHPVVRTAASILAERVDELPDWATEYVLGIEAENTELHESLKATEAELMTRDVKIEALEDEVLRLKRNFAEVSRFASLGEGPGVSEPLSEPASVREAVDRAIEEAGDTCLFLESAVDSAYVFSHYEDPGKMYRAIGDVAEASSKFADGSLGMSLGQWFRNKGYLYEGRNNAARAPKTKASYRITYKDRDEYMEPHLKVDEATSPDQCLRIYWYIDEEERIFVVGRIGRHLPS